MTRLFTRSFPVAGRRVIISQAPEDDDALILQWEPSAPESLTPAEWRQYQERRNQVLVTMAVSMGKPIVVRDPAPFEGGALQRVQALPDGHITIAGSTNAEPNTRTRTAKEITQRYLMNVSDHIAAGTINPADILRALLNGIQAIIDVSGIDPAVLKRDPKFMTAYCQIGTKVLSSN